MMKNHILSIAKAAVVVAFLVGGNATSAQTPKVGNDTVVVTNSNKTKVATNRNRAVEGNGNVVTRTYDIMGTFDEVVTMLPASVNYTVADKVSCTVHVDENLLEYLDVRLDDDALIFCLVDDKWNYNRQLKPTEFTIDLASPRLEKVGVVGSGDFNFLDPANGKELELNLTGSGDIVFQKEANITEIDLNVMGSGDIVFEEMLACDDLDANIAGSGKVSVKYLKARDASLNVAGSGDALIEQGDIVKMEANVTGSGSIESHAELNHLDAHVMGSGEITAKVNLQLDFSTSGSGRINYYGDVSVISGVISDRDHLRKIDAPAKAKSKKQ